VGMGTTPGTENNSYPNFTKDLFAAEANPYYALFVEDTYRPVKSFTITAGLRWDIFGGKTERHNRFEYFEPSAQSTVNGVAYTGAEIYVNGSRRSPFDTNFKDFGPRLGFSWQPIHSLVVRGGGGFYYGPSPHMVGSANLNSDGFSSQTTWNATAWDNDPNTIAYDCPDPSVPCSSQGNTIMVSSLSNPFPNGVNPQLTSPPSGLGNNLGLLLNTMLRSQRTPTTYNYNFGAEYELPHQVVVSAGYVGSRGLFIPLGSADLNTLDLATIGQYQSSLLNNTVPNTWGTIQPPTNANYGADMVPLWVSVQQYPQFGSGNYGDGNGVIVHGYPGGDSNYNSLQTKVQKRLSNHFTALAAFTWAKLMTDDGNPPLGFVGSHAGAPQDWKDLHLEHAVSPQDVKYQFTGSASYDLPFGKGMHYDLNGIANAFLGGWTFNLIAYLSTGVPIASPIVGAGTSYFNQRPDLGCDPSKGAPHNAGTWFNYNCFVFPSSPFVAGNAPAYLDHVRTMGANDFDISLYKHLKLGGERDLRFEISSYNIANRAQLGTPSVPSITDVQSQPSVAATFGQITATINTPRQFQFGARFSF
jgi:hypothetical protein